MADKDPMLAGDEKASQEVKKSQGKAGWPKPGDEGFVHPDGTPQSVQQLADNRRAALDRAAAGSVVHGGPTTGVSAEQADLNLERANKRAASDKDVEPGAGYDDPESRNTSAGNE
jgi:hypothetical protein